MSSFKSYYYTFDEPIPYRGLLIHPVKLKDYYEFSFYVQCLMLEKNSIKNPQLAIKAISMSYLQYLYEYPEKIKIGDVQYEYYILLDGLLRLVLNIKDSKEKIEYGNDENGIPYFKVMGKKYNSQDFDEIRKIIAEQNLIDLPDERIQKNVRESLEEARRFKQRLSNNKTASFEEQIMALATYTGFTLEYIYEMTYRKFVLAIKRANQTIMSQIYLTLSGFVTFKDKSVLRSWLANIDSEDKYSDVKMSPEQLQAKANFEEALKK